MFTSVIASREELYQFVTEAALKMGDPSRAVCQLVVRWGDGGPWLADEDTGLGAGWDPETGALVLLLGDSDPLTVPVSGEEPEMVDGALVRFQAIPLGGGVWTLNPSLNIPGVLHAFVVLTGVPDPAPWTRLVILAGDAAWMEGFGR
jgi:hypothetical protein